MQKRNPGEKTSQINLRQFITLISTTLFVWLFSIFGFLGSLDILVYNFFFKYSRWVAPPEKQVMLVVLDSMDDPDESQMVDFLRKIESFQPSKVVFSSVRNTTAPEFLEVASSYGNVVIGIQISAKEADRQELGQSVEWLFQGNDSTSPNQFGLSVVPHSIHGTYRDQYTHVKMGDKMHASLEYQAAYGPRTALATEKDTADPVFWIDFLDPHQRLPEISFKRMMDGNFFPSMIKGKHVLVGYARQSDEAGFFTPVSTESSMLSILEYQGQALNTLVNGNRIIDCRPWTVFLVLMLVAMLNIMVLFRVDVRFSLWLILSFLVFFSFITAVFLGRFKVWLPCSEVVIAQLLLYVWVLRYKNVVLTQGLNTLFLNVNGRLRTRYYPASIYEIEEHWERIVVMITQTLDLNRLIFLERIEGDHRLREIQSYNCSLDDIDERRRDYLRTPYSTALLEKGPIIIPGTKPFLKTMETDEIQYLTPLTVAGDVLGFWSFGISHEKRELIPDFMSIVRNFAAIVGELVYNRQENMPSKSLRKQVFSYFLREKAVEEQKLQMKTIYLLEKQLASLNEIFNGLSTLTVVYDLFGRVIYINHSMLAFLKQNDIQPFSISLVDLFCKLSDMELPDSQQALRQLIIYSKPLAQMVTFHEKDYMLNLKPMRQELADLQTADPAPFGVAGVILEMTDQSPLLELNKIKEELTNRFSAKLKNNLGIMQLSSTILKKDNLEKSVKENVYHMMAERIRESKNVLDEFQHFIEKSSEVFSSGELFPLNPLQILKTSIAELDIDMEKFGISIDISTSFSVSSVVASLMSLKQLYKNLLRLLLEDAKNNSIIQIVFSELQDAIEITFKNDGFGISNDLIEKSLYSDNQEISRTFSQLRQSVHHIEQWKGTLKINGELGQGLEIKLFLKK